MSGDIGRGATKEAVDFAVHLAAARNKPHGFYQLAGGTNAFTIKSLKKQGLFQTMTIDGKLLYTWCTIGCLILLCYNFSQGFSELTSELILVSTAQKQ
ncbi:hypothetical protein GW17_00056483 [Ensete ventricosum]|uniref:Uncharacterized protein n=1 Tax=Ensete ventricosum TaxID=4639 RepID=A0A444C849_ENSVE|nr:hypothetical protein B296_00039051 [Ensete ventricosum]RWV82050.1 hypothetical protein GW17_00056483 [Ensete ventricosum]RZS18171.1 hypothetical protein BHM03_00050396 [Ensete ventricosum]